MKKLNLLLLCLIVFGFSFVACSDDDDGGDGEDGYDSYVADGSAYEQWTYFDFATGTGRTLEIKGIEGAVTGIYYGSLDISVRGQAYGSQDSVKMVVTRISQDSVSIEMCDLTISMSEDPVEPFTLMAYAKAEKRDGKWILTGTQNECDVVNGENTKVWKVKFNGEIGLTKDAEVKITGEFTPGEMPFPLNATYDSKVENSKIYEVDGDESSFDWDIAFHKYDIRTNGGAVVKTDYTSLNAVTAIPADGYEEDVEGEVIADMSLMMKGFVGYQYCTLNRILCSWVTATPTGTMPPYTYELNKNIFIVKTKAGKYAKVKFTDTTNEKGKAVYAAFSYEYPIQ